MTTPIDLPPELAALTTAGPDEAGGRSFDQVQAVLALQRAGLAVVGHLEPDRICNALIAELESLLPYERSLVAVVNPRDGSIEVLAHAGRDIEESAAERARITQLIQGNPDGGVIRWVVENGRSLRVNDTTNDDRYLVGASQMRSELCVPIVLDDRVIGAINVESQAPDAFTRVDELVLSAIASPVAVALENARLYSELGQELRERARTERELAVSEERYRAVVENAGEAILVLVDGRIDFANSRACSLFALNCEELQPLSLGDLIDERERDRLDGVLASALDGAGHAGLQNVALSGAEERRVNVNLSRIAWRDAHGVLCFVSDVTETWRLTARLSHEASHDALTGLVNRREFENRLARLLDESQAGEAHHVMCYLDLDQFKVINDACGHRAGDELLVLLSQRLGDVVRERDTLARLGGDEFAVLLEHCGVHHGIGVAEKLVQLVREFRMLWEGREYSTGVSIGLVEVTPGMASVADVLRAADAACYLAKEDGRGRVRVYRENDRTIARRSAQMNWVTRVRSALDAGRFALHCQPIESLQELASSRRYEILLRLLDEGGSLVPPGVFLPAVENYDLAVALDRYVVDRVIAWMSDNPERLAQTDMIAINLSGRSLGDADLLAFITGTIASSPVPAHKLCFEITETAAIRNTRTSIHFMEVLGDLGCHFALDDFGAGLSSFRYLKDLPAGILKLDGSFVRGLPNDTTAVALVSAIQSLARTLGMTTVAEFAVSRAIVDALRQIGVDYAQGDGIRAPFPLNDIADGMSPAAT